MRDFIGSRQDHVKRHKRLKNFWIGLLLIIIFLGLTQFASQFLKREQISLIAIDTETGKVAWSAPLSSDNELLVAFTTAQTDRVFVGMATDVDKSSDHHKSYQIQAFHAVSGQKLWTFAPILSEPYRAEDMAFELPLYAQGETLWLNVLLETAPKGSINNSDAANGQPEKQIAPLPNIRNGQVIAIDTITGQSQWAIDRDWNIDLPEHNGLAGSGDRISMLRIMPTQQVWLETYQASTGKKIWQTQLATSRKLEEAPSNLYRAYRLTANPDAIFSSSVYSKIIQAYDWETGKLRFEIQAENPQLDMATSDSTLYIRSYTRVAAFDSRTGIRRWTVNLASPNPDKCLFLEDVAAVIDGVYIACRGSQNSHPEINLLFLNTQTGRKQELTTISNARYDTGSAYGSNSFLAWIRNIPEEPKPNSQLVKFVKESDREVWSWQPNYRVDPISISLADDRVFNVGYVPRWQNLKSKYTLRLSGFIF